MKQEPFSAAFYVLLRRKRNEKNYEKVFDPVMRAFTVRMLIGKDWR